MLFAFSSFFYLNFFIQHLVRCWIMRRYFKIYWKPRNRFRQSMWPDGPIVLSYSAISTRFLASIDRSKIPALYIYLKQAKTIYSFTSLRCFVQSTQKLKKSRKTVNLLFSWFSCRIKYIFLLKDLVWDVFEMVAWGRWKGSVSCLVLVVSYRNEEHC